MFQFSVTINHDFLLEKQLWEVAQCFLTHSQGRTVCHDHSEPLDQWNTVQIAYFLTTVSCPFSFPTLFLNSFLLENSKPGCWQKITPMCRRAFPTRRLSVRFFSAQHPAPSSATSDLRCPQDLRVLMSAFLFGRWFQLLGAEAQLWPQQLLPLPAVPGSHGKDARLVSEPVSVRTSCWNQVYQPTPSSPARQFYFLDFTVNKQSVKCVAISLQECYGSTLKNNKQFKCPTIGNYVNRLCYALTVE